MRSTPTSMCMTPRSTLRCARCGVRAGEAGGIPTPAAGRGAGRDRLEILAALISSPSFDPLYRDDIIKIPGGHPIYRWECVVGSCERPRTGGSDLCSIHQRDWASQSGHGVGKAAFVAAAVGLERRTGAEEIACRICVKRPAAHNELRLCQRHLARWDLRQRTPGGAADFAQWVSEEQPCFSYGTCAAVVCPNLAE